MLNGTLTLHDINDVERYCTNILADKRNLLESTFAKAGRPFTPHDAETYVTYLIEKCWERSRDETQWRTSFSGWVGTKLRHHDTIEYLRTELKRTVWKFADRTYERQRPTFTTLDDQLADTLPAPLGDPAEDRNPDLTRALTARSSDDAWRHHHRRQRLPQRAA